MGNDSDALCYRNPPRHATVSGLIDSAAAGSFRRVPRDNLPSLQTSSPSASWSAPPIWFGLLGAGIAGFLLWFIYAKPAASGHGAWLGFLPTANASLNALAAVCLTAGFINVKRGNIEAHKKCMLAALGFSTLFLAGYLVYHHFHGDTPFPGRGAIRPVYFSILISHIVLSVLALPLVLTTVFYALGGRFESHKKIARLTFPVWLYVSVSGVAVYFFLRAYA